MDYKYIKCLIDRYFDCQTTIEEEQILRQFFMQDSLPAELQQYKPLFTAMQAEEGAQLDADFDQMVMERIQSLEPQKPTEVFKARIISFNRSLSPFYKAVASIALIITVGLASNSYWASNSQEPTEYNYSSYQDTYSNPTEACAEVVGALKDLSSAFNGDVATDSSAVTKSQVIN